MLSGRVMDRLKSWISRGKASPQMVQIYPTNFCNLKCIFCTQRTGVYEEEKEVKKERWFEIVKELCEMGVEEILISGGGEPLCVPDITIGIMKIAKFYGLKGRIITNGALWKKSHIEEAIKLNWDTITFSLDAPDAETHDYLRGVKGAFRRTIKTMREFRDIKLKKRVDYPVLEITTVLNLYNYKKIDEIIKLANKLGVVSLNIEPICINNPTCEKIKLGVKEREEFLRSVRNYQNLAKKYNVRTNLERLTKLKYLERSGNLLDLILKTARKNDFLNLPCYEPWLWPKIEANGEVWPCSSISLHENIKHKSFKEIWFGKEFQLFRRKIMKNDLPPNCSNCVMTHLATTMEIRDELSKEFKTSNM